MTTREARELLHYVTKLAHGKQIAQEASLHDLARITHISVPTLSRLFRNKGLMDAITFLKLVAWIKA